MILLTQPDILKGIWYFRKYNFYYLGVYTSFYNNYRKHSGLLSGQLLEFDYSLLLKNCFIIWKVVMVLRTGNLKKLKRLKLSRKNSRGGGIRTPDLFVPNEAR